MSRSRLGVSTILALALAAFVNAQEKKDPPQDPPKVDPKPADPKQPDPKPGDGKRFEFAFTKDKKFHQETTTTVIQIIKVQGQDLTQTQSSTFWFEWTPTEQTPDGKWKVKQKVDGLKMTIDISGNLINYDSTKADSAATGNPALNEFFKKLVGAEFTATIDKNSRVESVAGKNEFIASLGAGSPQMDALLKKVLTDDALKDMCDPTLKLVPDAGKEPKKAGDTWERKAPLNLGPIGTYEVTYKFTYAGLEKDLEKITVDATLTYVAPKENPDGLLFRIKEGTLTSEGPAKGTIFYNPKAQRPESAEINLKLKGSLTVTIGGTDTKVELQMEQKTATKFSDTSSKPGAVPPPPPPK